MTQQLDIGSFLDSRRSEGQKESEGGFTVSHSNAARKLAKFALPRPYAWVSKLVQAAVAWKCRELRVTQDKISTRFHFITDNLSTLPTEQELVSCMLSGKVGGELPIEHFSVGLRSLVEQTHLSFLLVIFDGEIEPKPVYAGAYFGSISERERLSQKYQGGKGITLTVAHIPTTDTDSHWLLGKKYELKIVQELDLYCFLSPIPIQVDGRRVDGLLRSSIYGSSERYRPLLMSGAHEDDPDFELPLPETFEEKQLSLYSHPRRTLRSYGGKKNFSSVFLCGLQLPRIITKYMPTAQNYSSIHWIRHGVLVESTKLPVRTLGLSCQVFANAEGLQSDLTGFQLVESSEKAARQTIAVRAAGKHMDEVDFRHFAFRADRDQESEIDEKLDAQLASKRRIKILLKGSGTGLFLTLFNPPIGIPTTLGSIVAAYLPKDDKVMAQIRQHASVFEEILATDRTALVATLKLWTSLGSDPE